MATVFDPESWELGRALGYESALWAEGGKPTSQPVTIVSIPANAKLVVLRGFNRRSAGPLKTHIPLIRAVADNIIKRRGTSNQVSKIRLVGHTADGISNENSKFDLGLKRARQVRMLLTTFLNISSLTSPSFTAPPFIESSAGTGLPDSSTASDNRRVEIILE